MATSIRKRFVSDTEFVMGDLEYSVGIPFVCFLMILDIGETIGVHIFRMVERQNICVYVLNYHQGLLQDSKR